MLWSFQAYHIGGLHGIPATNEILSFLGNTIFKFNDGLIDTCIVNISEYEVIFKLKQLVLHRCRNDCSFAICFLQNMIAEKLSVQFTHQEMKCLILWLFSHSLKICSKYLNASEKTIANHRANITFKLQGKPLQIISRFLFSNDYTDILSHCERIISTK